MAAQEGSIEHRPQSLVLGELIRRREQGQQRQAKSLSTQAKTRSLSTVSWWLRIALLPMNSSSRKSNSASGSISVVTVATDPSRSRAGSFDPKISFGSAYRVSRYSS